VAVEGGPVTGAELPATEATEDEIDAALEAEDPDASPQARGPGSGADPSGYP
jgi:hypothetical protein